MTKLEEIEGVVETLSKQEFRELFTWMAKRDNDLWDRQIDEDARAGKFDDLAKAALAEYQAGLSKKI